MKSRSRLQRGLALYIPNKFLKGRDLFGNEVGSLLSLLIRRGEPFKRYFQIFHELFIFRVEIDLC